MSPSACFIADSSGLSQPTVTSASSRISRGQRIERGRPFWSRTVSVTSARCSIAPPQNSPSPWAAWQSPTNSSAPGTLTGRKIVAPGFTSGQSMFPPYRPEPWVDSASRCGAVPIVPTIGRVGKRIWSLKTTSPFSIGKIRVWGSGNHSGKWADSGQKPVNPCVSQTISSIVIASVSPGSAPSTSSGPVTGFE